MYTDTRPTARTIVTAFAGAAIYTGLLFAVSASPAQAATTGDAGFVRTIEAQIGQHGWASTSDRGVSTVAVRIDADGKVTGATVAGSSGRAGLDRDALATAKALSYPATGRNRTVAVVLRYGDAKLPAAAKSAALVNRYVNSKGEALAAETPAPNAG